MEDPRTQAILEMAVTLIASGAAQYASRSIAEVTAELLGSAQGIDNVFGVPLPTTDDEGEQ